MFAKNVATITSLFNKFAITFSNTTVAEAAAWLAFAEAARTTAGIALGKDLKDMNRLKTSIETKSDTPINGFTNQTMIQFNESPDQKGKVLTVGQITANGVNGSDPGNASDLTEIVKYLNDFNISSVAAADYSGKVAYMDQFLVNPFRGRRDGYIGDTNSFIGGQPGKDAGAGSLNLEGAYDDVADYAVFYAPQKFTAASAVSTGGQTTDITWTPGPETKADLPKNMFPVLSIKLDPSMAPLIATAIEGAKKLGQITNLRIESGASFDEPVKLDNAGFAKAVGMAPNQVPATPTEDKEGTVTDPMSGGNAFLAYMRGKAIQTAIGNTAGVTPTMVAKVATGGDAARYAALYFSIKMPDGSTTTTKDSLVTLGQGTNVEQLGGQFKVVRVTI